jgi:gliding motility-associated-like protein
VNIKVFCDGANLTMPNAFTPNGDGNNDIFYVRGTGFSVKSFSIYNRLGQLVFKKENFLPNDPQQGWDGTFGGQAISDAAGFVYMIEIICYNSSNEPELLKGTVLMIK